MTSLDLALPEAVTTLSDLMIYIGDLVHDEPATIALLQDSGTFGVVIGYYVENLIRGNEISLLLAIYATGAWSEIARIAKQRMHPELDTLLGPSHLCNKNFTTLANHIDSLGFTEEAHLALLAGEAELAAA